MIAFSDLMGQCRCYVSDGDIDRIMIVSLGILCGTPNIDHLADPAIVKKFPGFTGAHGLNRRSEKGKEEGQRCGYSDQNKSRHEPGVGHSGEGGYYNQRL